MYCSGNGGGIVDAMAAVDNMSRGERSQGVSPRPKAIQGTVDRKMPQKAIVAVDWIGEIVLSHLWYSIERRDWLSAMDFRGTTLCPLEYAWSIVY